MDKELYNNPWVRDDVRRLIQLVSGCKDDTKAKISDKSVMSKLSNLQCRDVNRRAVKQSVTGMATKFFLQGRNSKGKRFQELADKFTQRKEFMSHPQVGLQWKFLSLVLSLSRPDTGDGVRKVDSEKTTSKEEKVDWKKLLLEDNIQWKPDEESDSEWSDEDLENLPSEPSAWQQLQESANKSEELIRSVNECKAILNSNGNSNEDVKNESDFEVQSPYWLTRHQIYNEPAVAERNVTANLANLLENAQAAKGISSVKTKKLSEYQVVREVLWLLMCPADSFLFKWQRGKFHVLDNVTIPSLSQKAFHSILNDFCVHFTHIKTVRDFMDSMSPNSREESWSAAGKKVPPLTYKAYASALAQFISRWNQEVCALEKEVMKQDKTVTLITLSRCLAPSLKLMREIYKIHLKAVSDWTRLSSWFCSIKLLSVLCAAADGSHSLAERKFFIAAFLQSLHPYVNMMETLLGQGRIQDPRQEFIIVRNTQVKVKDDDFWKNSFQVKAFESKLTAEGLQCPKIFHTILPLLVQCGKSRELLAELERGLWGKVPDSALYASIVQTFPELDLVSDIAPKAIVKNSSSRDLLMKHMEYVGDALLLAEYASFYNMQDESVEDECAQEGVSLSEQVALRPCWMRLEDVLLPRVKKLHAIACKELEERLAKEFYMQQHLSVVRKVFFLEAGDAMHLFYSQLFEMVSSSEDWCHSLSLTALLEQSIYSCCGDFTTNFCIDMDEPLPVNASFTQFEHLKVRYMAPWPVTLVLTSSNLDVYNQVFHFILKLQRVLFSLQKLHFKDLEVQNSWNPAQTFEELAPNHLKHRCHLLRAWFLHCLGSICSYCLGQVIPTATYELGEKLKVDPHLDSIITAHEEYLRIIFERCFLHSKFRIAKEVIEEVLKQALTFCNLWRNGRISTLILCELEDNYSESHKLLAETLTTLVRSSLLYLEGLTAALVYSCPSKD